MRKILPILFVLLLFAVPINAFTAKTTVCNPDGTRCSDVDATTGGIKVIETDHHEVHEGNVYNIQDSDTDISTGDSPNFLSICFDTPNMTNSWVHAVASVYASGGMLFEMYENPPTVTGGSVGVSNNRNRNSANTTTVTTPLTDTTALLATDRAIETNATVCADGTTELVVTTVQDPHGLVAGDPVVFVDGTGGVCTGITAGTTYYVESVLTTTTFQISATKGGVAIDYTDAGTAFNSSETGGTILELHYFGSGNNNEGVSRGSHEWILKNNETYCWKATSEGQNLEMDLDVDYYIHIRTFP